MMRQHGAPRSRDRSEQGASLIIALVFIVVVAVIVGAISSLALNDLNNTGNFNSATGTTYAATNVANLAIQAVRYNPQSVNGTAGPCWGNGTSEQAFDDFNANVTVAIWCNSVAHNGSSQSRVVTMYACPLPLGANETNCQNSPLLTLVEAYDDYSASGTDTCSAINSGSSTCGFGASTLVWTWGPLTATGGLILNTISVNNTPPSLTVVNGVQTVTNGSSWTPAVSTTSGDPAVITIATTSASYCTVSGGTVNFTADGQCTVNFNDPGNFLYAQAQQVTYTYTVAG
jgi:hypothetical protein